MRRRLTPQARRQEIFTTAVRLLRQSGTAVRVEDIVAAAGAAKGTFYTCFATWDDLLDAIRADLIADFKAENRHLFLPQTDTNWPLLLPDLAERFIAFMMGMEGLHDVLFHSPFALNRPLPPQERPAAYIATLLDAGQAAGAYAVMDSQVVAQMIFALIHDTADAIMAAGESERRLAALKLALQRLTLKEMPQ